ncbi:hypothetical protein cypCar_00003293 [Cyprinus carpio]|nr:hypothetical protein cypCar_00003293 [Cyprinus carpio]
MLLKHLASCRSCSCPELINHRSGKCSVSIHWTSKVSITVSLCVKKDTRCEDSSSFYMLCGATTPGMIHNPLVKTKNFDPNSTVGY